MAVAMDCRHGSACGLLSEEGLEPGEQGIFAIQHIVERGHRNRVRAMIAQEAAERVELTRRAVQRHHSGGRRPANGETTPKRASASAKSAALQAVKRVRTSR